MGHERITPQRLFSKLAPIILPLVMAWALVAVLVVLQGRHNEAHQADAILVFCTATTAPLDDFLKHTLVLYEDGYAPRVLIVGEGKNDQDVQTIQTTFAQIQTQTFFMATTGNRRQDIQAIARYTTQQQIHSIVLVDSPAAMLVSLKMSQDGGLKAYGSPPPNVPLHTLAVGQASFAYWQYVLFASHSVEH